ncbi:hypothetical protein SAMN05444003_2835 [Cognatiyoonia sediminum]|uniref:Transferrin-binding protein B C-lobe/N-lobe beta barrel domain-containing protein n=1 Tax=Cognatiyoonia sediminum TaxID=1508389 RepID=A0A1M5S3I1_9RHOB|nr:hypothetical protein [Cognatiyoonia sediminum]SHH33016.1 hypothetical protein SAMN05444003_2835 [Cognatiyoonia sediminum]
MGARTIGLFLALGFATGCGGGAVAPTQAPSFSAQVDSFDAEFSRARGQDFSTSGSVSSASGSYSGTTVVRVLDGGAPSTFLGDASLTVDIAGGTVSGSLRGFTRRLSGSNEEHLNGRLTVRGQSIGVSQDSEFISTVSGTLTGDSTDFRLGSGTLFGDLLQNPTSSLVGQGTFTNSTLDGRNGLTSTVNVLADKD